MDFNLGILGHTPSSPPSGNSVIGNPDTTFSATRGVTVVAGAAGLWKTAAQEDASSLAATAAAPGIQFNATAIGGVVAGGINGTRFIMTFTGVPTGIQIWVPQQIGNFASSSGASAATTGTVGGAGPARLSLVTGTAADGSGGTLAADVLNQFVPITTSGGTAVAVYEVAQGPISTAFTIQVAFLGTAPTAVGVINIATGLAPVGPPTAGVARPQFNAAPAGIEIAETRPCVTYLLFPFVVNTNDGNFDTGMAIANTSADPINALAVAGTRGAVPTSGNVTLYFHTLNGTPPAPRVIATNLGAGGMATFVLSSLGTPFTGYVIAVCNFAWAHGFAFIDNPIGGQSGFAQAYEAVVLPNRRIIVPEAQGL